MTWGLTLLIGGLVAFIFGKKSDYSFRKWFQLGGAIAGVFGVLVLLPTVSGWLNL